MTPVTAATETVWSAEDIPLAGATLRLRGATLRLRKGGAGDPLLVLPHDIGTLDRLPFYDAIAPSMTLTERIRPLWEKRTAEEQAREIARTPLRRMAEALDQARVICFLASSDADFVTGVTINVTGGI